VIVFPIDPCRFVPAAQPVAMLAGAGLVEAIAASDVVAIGLRPFVEPVAVVFRSPVHLFRQELLHELVLCPRKRFRSARYGPSLGIEVLKVAAMRDQEMLEIPVGRAVAAVQPGPVLHRTGAAAIVGGVDQRAERAAVEAAVELPPFGNPAPAV